MPWPLPSAKNYGHDATMRGFRTGRHVVCAVGGRAGTRSLHRARSPCRGRISPRKAVK